MSLLRSAYREVVFGGHLLALGTASIAATAALLIGKSPTWQLLLMAYLFSYGAYTVNRSADIEQDAVSSPERTSHLQGRKRYLTAISAICFALGYLLAAFRNVYFLLALLAPLGLTLAYSVGSKRMVRIVGVSRLKEKLLVKNAVTAFGWSLIPVLVGFYYLSFPVQLLLLAPFVFMRLLANTIFFDVRDVKADSSFGIKTLPSAYGIDASFSSMAILDVMSAVYLVPLVAAGLLPVAALVLLGLPVYSFAYRYLSRRANANLDLLCDVVADGEYILWGPLLYLARI
ncbi:MAG TPA: UbiA family prenyltransferase [Nitrososphaerales archaeon]|nr:UbiA family prenyltransferase [Nitrososphaerales archaeon]